MVRAIDRVCRRGHHGGVGEKEHSTTSQTAVFKPVFFMHKRTCYLPYHT